MDPRLTIGLPVYDGENYLANAVESILAQTFTDFRLVIVDNASRDGTEAIARRFARQDARVQYRRNEVNIGAGPNFNRAFEFADSEFFKWASHDDELAATFLEQCVAALDQNPTAVLAHSWVNEIDDQGRCCDSYRPFPPSLGSPHRRTRFAGRVLMRGRCTEVFGVIRTESLRRTPLIASYIASDLSLITELSLLGAFELVPEPLFHNRVHAERYSEALFNNSDRTVARQQVLEWFDARNHHSKRRMLWYFFFLAYFPMIRRHVSGRRERLLCYLIALRWLTVRNNIVDLTKDLLFSVNPRLLQRLLWLKQSWQGRGMRAGA